MTPFISICIPAYKRVQGLGRLLDSIRQQTFTNFEIVITDDTPDTSIESFLAGYADLNINYGRNSPPAGVPLNWNLGFGLAVGEWIKVMHDDDWFSAPSSLLQFAEAAQKTGADLVASAYEDVYENGLRELHSLDNQTVREIAGNPYSLYYENKLANPSTTMFRASLQMEYDERFGFLVDLEFYIRLIEPKLQLEYLEDPLISIGRSSTQLTNSYWMVAEKEIPEFLNLLSIWPDSLPYSNKKVFHSLWNLVRRYKITDVKILENIYHGSIPRVLLQIIDRQKNIPRFILKQTPFSKWFAEKMFRNLSNS